MRLLDHAKGLALIAVTLLCVACTIFIFDLDRSIKGWSSELQKTNQKLNNDLDEAHRLILEASLTAMEARKASADERQFLKQWNTQLSQTMLSANKLIANLDESQSRIAEAAVGTLSAATSTESSMQPVIATTLATTNATISDLDRLLKSKDLLETLKHLDGTSTHVDSITGMADTKLNDLMHPPKCEGKWCWAKRTWTIIQDAHDIPEMYYWLEQSHLLPMP
jgi:hypothetical protein